MQLISSAYGEKTHFRLVERQLSAFLAEIGQKIQAQKSMLRGQEEINEQGRKEMREAINASRRVLDDRLDVFNEMFVQDLEASRKLLAERVKRAVERARNELEQTFVRWQRVHHMTIAAVCRRGGVHVGTTGRNDFPADLSKPILDGIAFAWSDFFGEHLQTTLKKWTDSLLLHADAFQERLKGSLMHVSESAPDLIEDLEAIFDTAKEVLQEKVAQTNNQMEDRIQHEQRTLYESVTEQVRANMKPAFAQASEETGRGMKDRMVEILAGHARQVSQTKFDDARDTILNGIGGLNSWLAREYQEIIKAVQRNANLAEENLVVSGERVTSQALTAELGILSGLNDLVAKLKQDTAA